jgi:hypothetical protein
MMARRTPTVIEVVGVLTILLGIVRGTLLGPVRTLEFLFGTSYGITWGIALLLGLAILAWSRFVVGPQSDRMQAAVEMGDAATLRGAMPLLLVELLGFFGIFTCMILMRFGL